MRKGKLLSKVPCNDDLFEGGAHRKLAIEISDMRYEMMIIAPL